MRKLKIMEHISLDGVIQQSTDNDEFPYSGWTTPLSNPRWRPSWPRRASASIISDLRCGHTSRSSR
jgi:hypothetical protein